MIRKLFYIISMVSVLALLSACADTSLRYKWIHYDGDSSAEMKGRLTLNNDAWDDGEVQGNEVLSWSLQASGPLEGFKNAGSHNSLSSFNYFELLSSGVGGYEVYFPPLVPISIDNVHLIRMDHKLDGNFDQDRLWFDYSYRIDEKLRYQGSGYFQRVYENLTYQWISDNCSHADFYFDATLTVKGDAWNDGILNMPEVVNWSFTINEQTVWNDGWHIAEKLIYVNLYTNGVGHYEIYFLPSTTLGMEHILHWVVMDQVDGTGFNVEEIPMTASFWLDPDANGGSGTYVNCTGRLVLQIPASDPPSPPTGLQLPREEVQEVEVQRP